MAASKYSDNIDSPVEIAALARLYSTALLRKIASGKPSAMLARLLRQSRLADISPEGASLADAYEAGFEVLQSQANRHECVYKSVLVNKKLLGTHSLNTAVMLSEFRTGGAIADLVLLNGVGTVFEIKSERDRLDKLLAQVAEYRQAFLNVCVVLGGNHTEHALRTLPAEVGVYEISSRLRVSCLRPEIECASDLKTGTMLACLRRREMVSLLAALQVSIPDVPNTRLWRACAQAVGDRDVVEVHAAMLAVLKQHRCQRARAEFVAALPSSLRAAGLAFDFSAQARDNLGRVLSSPVRSLMTWG